MTKVISPKGGYGHNNDLWSEILPGLWMGGTSDHATLGQQDSKPEITNLHFDTVATLYASALPVDWYVKELRLGFYDHDQVDIDQHDLDQLVTSLYSDWQAGKRVLIRCQAGWNRSGLITGLVLMREGFSAEEAIDLIRRMRSPNALCNSTFEQYLKEQEHSSVGV
jgi:protein tyrosine/serine phosphatase